MYRYILEIHVKEPKEAFSALRALVQKSFKEGKDNELNALPMEVAILQEGQEENRAYLAVDEVPPLHPMTVHTIDLVDQNDEDLGKEKGLSWETPEIIH